jgi:glycosyltransferase involved in cell wall biosynthesis
VADPVTVAIPVRNGGPRLAQTLAAVRAQRVDRPVELLVADSGSSDGSPELARGYGAAIIDVPAGEFSHGGTRNLLTRRAGGSHIAFITQDAVPADEHWLTRLLGGFELADDVGLVFGAYRPRPEASPMVRRELEEWFASLSADGGPHLDRGLPSPGDPDLVRRLFFTDANGCAARAALERVPFREVAYAEDHLLARDMLAAGYAKVYRPDAAVVHSHNYRPFEQFRRSFDEWRSLREVHGIAATAGPVRATLLVQRSIRDDIALLRREDRRARALVMLAAASLRYHVLRAAGAALGSRAQRLPAAVRRVCSLERRA